jgi:hypothetical protein
MKTIRVAALAVLTLLVGAVMLIAGGAAFVITLAMYPFCYVRNTANLALEALIRDLWRPGG